MTWGLTKKYDCYKCANVKRCYVNSASWNLAPILTSVDKLIPTDDRNYECAGGNLIMECNAFVAKEGEV